MNSGVKRKRFGNEESPESLKRKHTARERWRILAETIKGHGTSETQQSSVSVRRFQTFGLLKTQKSELCMDGDDGGASWYNYSFSAAPGLTVIVRHVSDTIKPADLLGFNNTGNVCVWPSEEVMAYYCLQHWRGFRGTSVIEIGGGMTSLAGVAVAVSSEADKVVLTDGNEQSLYNLQCVIKTNDFGATAVSARFLCWGPDPVEEDLREQFDYVLCADCLFFDDGREHLVQTVYALLKPGGHAWMFAPSRNQTFDKFCDLARDTFQLKRLEQYDETVWNLHLQMKATSKAYEEDLHYPLFIQLTKPNHQQKDNRDTTPESR